MPSRFRRDPTCSNETSGRAARFLSGGDPTSLTSEQEALVVANLHLARACARRYPQAIYEDAYQDGCIGLMDAARTWDGTGAFGGYAHTRISGEMAAGLRKRTGWLRRGWHRSQPASLDYATDNGSSLADLLADIHPDPCDHIADRDLCRCLIAKLLADASPSDRTILATIFDGGTQRDAAHALGITETAVGHHMRKLRRIAHAHLNAAA